MVKVEKEIYNKEVKEMFVKSKYEMESSQRTVLSSFARIKPFEEF